MLFCIFMVLLDTRLNCSFDMYVLPLLKTNKTKQKPLEREFFSSFIDLQVNSCFVSGIPSIDNSVPFLHLILFAIMAH